MNQRYESTIRINYIINDNSICYESTIWIYGTNQRYEPTI